MDKQAEKAIRELLSAVKDLRDYVAIKIPPAHDDCLIGCVDIALAEARETLDRL